MIESTRIILILHFYISMNVIKCVMIEAVEGGRLIFNRCGDLGRTCYSLKFAINRYFQFRSSPLHATRHSLLIRLQGDCPYFVCCRAPTIMRDDNRGTILLLLFYAISQKRVMIYFRRWEDVLICQFYRFIISYV